MQPRKFIIAVAVAAAVVGPLAVAAPAQAATRSHFSLKVAERSVLLGQKAHLRGYLTPGAKRAYSIQEYTHGHWATVFKSKTYADKHANITAHFETPGRHTVRFYAPATSRYTSATSNTVSWTVVTASKVTAKASSTTALVGARDAVTGKVSPAATGRVMTLQRWTGSHWVSVRSTKTVKGSYSLPVSTTTPGAATYRVVSAAQPLATSLVSAHLTVTTLARSTVTAAPDKTSMVFGDALSYVNGHVTPAGATQRKVRLYSLGHDGKTWWQEDYVYASASGAFSLQLPTSAGAHTYKVVADRVGYSAAATSATFTFTVKKAPSTVTATASATSVIAGSVVTISGAVSSVDVREDTRTIRLERLDGDTWVQIEHFEAGTDGQYMFNLDTMDTSTYGGQFGEHSYRAVAVEGFSGLEAVSAPFTINFVDPTTTGVP
ncbi:MAG: hypothetical protein ACTHLJ_12045 [Angustibacter sp.]